MASQKGNPKKVVPAVKKTAQKTTHSPPGAAENDAAGEGSSRPTRVATAGKKYGDPVKDSKVTESELLGRTIQQKEQELKKVNKKFDEEIAKLKADKAKLDAMIDDDD